jgi:hypothetical protein
LDEFIKIKMVVELYTIAYKCDGCVCVCVCRQRDKEDVQVKKKMDEAKGERDHLRAAMANTEDDVTG